MWRAGFWLLAPQASPSQLVNCSNLTVLSDKTFFSSAVLLSPSSIIIPCISVLRAMRSLSLTQCFILLQYSVADARCCGITKPTRTLIHLLQPLQQIGLIKKKRQNGSILKTMKRRFDIRCILLYLVLVDALELQTHQSYFFWERAIRLGTFDPFYLQWSSFPSSTTGTIRRTIKHSGGDSTAGKVNQIFSSVWCCRLPILIYLFIHSFLFIHPHR